MFRNCKHLISLWLYIKCCFVKGNHAQSLILCMGKGVEKKQIAIFKQSDDDDNVAFVRLHVWST